MKKEQLVKAIDSKVSINNPEWIEMVFEGRNQAYGAYCIRKESPERHLLSLFIACAIFIGAIVIPGLISKMIPQSIDERRERIHDFYNYKPILPAKTIKDFGLSTPKPQLPIRNTIKNNPPVIVIDNQVDDNQPEMKTQGELFNSASAIGSVDITEGPADNGAPVVSNVNLTEESTKVYDIVEIMPEYPGGVAALFQFIADNVDYPLAALEAGIQGVTYIRFVIDKTGAVTRIEVMRGFHSACDREAVRVVSQMAHWKPGRQGGRDVAVSFSLPIRFQLDRR